MEKICVFPGTFNPFTKGHLDIVERSSRLFDRVIVAAAVETGKTGVLDVKHRAALIEKCVSGFKNVSVRGFSGLLVDFCKAAGADVIVRGIRNYNDFLLENSLSLINRKLSENVETVFLITSPEHSHISSSSVRDLIRLKADITSFVPAEIKEDLIKLYREQVIGNR